MAEPTPQSDALDEGGPQAGLPGAGGARAAWAERLLAAPGPIAFALAAVLVVPMSLTVVGRPWEGLVVLAGAGLFWWTVMWVGGRAPRAGTGAGPIVPVLLLMAVFLARPMLSDPVGFFKAPAGSGSYRDSAWTSLPLDRELSVLAVEKLVVVLLLWVPLYHAVWLDRRAVAWFRAALLVGVGGLVVMAALQIALAPAASSDPRARAELAMLNRLPSEHVSAILSGVICWLVGTLLASARRWSAERRDHVAGDWAASLRGPNLLTMVLSGAVLAAAVALLAACLLGPVPWRRMAPWVGLAGGAGLVVMGRRSAVRWLGAALLAAGVVAACRGWPGDLLARSFRRGGAAGWSGWSLDLEDSAGVLWLVQWRGVVGLVVVAAALAAAGVWQARSLARVVEPGERLACGGAMVGSWMIVAGWMVGPAQVTGSAALLALSLWALSLGPPVRRATGPAVRRGGGRRGADVAGGDRPVERGAASAGRFSGYLVWVWGIVVFCYGLVGLVPLAHERMWLGLPLGGGDKWLHAVWGLYVTLACCVALSAWGRWAAVIVGAVCSVGLSFGAELIQKYWLVERTFEWLDVGAYAAAAAIVVVGLLLVPYRWARRREEAAGEPAGGKPA